MKMFLKKTDAILAFLIMFCIFYNVFAVSDMWMHTNFARVKLEERNLFSGNFLMYFLVNLFSGFSGTTHSTKVALVLLLSISNTAKYLIVKKAFEQWFHHKQAVLASVALLLVFVVPILYILVFFGFFPTLKSEWYLGYYVPNVWHNSTILCMMPFAILTYLLSVKQFEDYDRQEMA